MKGGASHEQIHETSNAKHLELKVDEAMLSIMGCDTRGRPKVFADKPWGRACGLAGEKYEGWLARLPSKARGT